MQILYLNTTTGEWFDKFGVPFRDQMPQVSFQGRETIRIYTVTDTPDAGELGIDPSSWEVDTQWSAMGANAQITVDNDYIHKIKGVLSSPVSAGSVASVSVKLANTVTESQVPVNGTLIFYNAAGQTEKLNYTSRDISGNVTVFATDGTLANSYASNDSVDVPQAPYCAARMTDNSAPGNGMFEFDLVADSLRLRDAMLYSNTASLAIQGLEILFYRTAAEGNIPVRAFICETFAIVGTLGDVDYNAPLPEAEAADRAYEIIAGIVGAGVELQYSTDGKQWQDYNANADLKNIKYIRWRNKQVGGEWSPSVPLIAGANGKSAYDVAVEQGFKGDVNAWLNSLIGEGEPGKSAYEVAVDAGYIGTVDEWLESLKGAQGNGLDYDASGTSEQEKHLYDEKPVGFKYAFAVADQEKFRTTLYIYTRTTEAAGGWTEEPLAIVFYGASKPEVTSVRPIEFTPPPDTDKVYYFAIPALADATIAQVCIDTEEGEEVLPYYSIFGVRKIIKTNDYFYIYFGSSVPKYKKGRVYLTQMVAADKSQGGGGGEVVPVGGTMYYGYLSSTSSFQSVTAITADMLEEDTIIAADATAAGAISLGVVPAGSFTVVLVPADSGLTVRKDDGFGGKVAFELDNGIAGSGANGATVTIGDTQYKVYGEFNLVDGVTTVHIN